MNLKELDSFKLSDSIKFHDTLNPRLWMGTRLRPEVKKQLLVIADDFIQELGIKDLDVKDITVSGSNAAYSYSDHSDFDLHILVDMNKLPHDEVYRELFNAKKTIYNDSHNIKVHGVPIELYVQDTNEPVVSLGEYSLLQDKWLKRPTKRRANFDQNATKAKYDKLEILVTHALKTKNLKLLNNVIQKIKQYRKAGLDKGGEFSPENLAYKVLRNQGYITKLYDLRDKLHSAKLSIENMYAQEDYHPNAKPRGPEFPPTMPNGTIRVDVSDVYDWYKLGQHISNMKGLGKHDFGKGPPSTILSFGDEDLEHKYIDALAKTGLDTTDIDPKGHEPKKGQKVDPTYNVNEAFDKPYKLRWSKGDHGDVDAYTKLPDGNYLSIMFNKGYSQGTKEEAWSVEFFRNNSQEVTGEGDAQRVFATVLSAIQTFIKKYKPNRVFFSASKEVEDGQKSYSRARLYDSLVQRYARAWGFKAFRADTGDKVIYELNRINKGVAEGYSNTTFNVDRRKLNVPALIQKGAIFVTYPHGEQGWETDNKEDWAYSLISFYNVLQGGWPSEAKKYLKPISYKKAEQQINSSAPNLGSDRLVYDGKYNQILWSIKKLGIPDSVAFLDKQGVAEARTNPEQNPKPESGMKELASIAKTINDPENWAISMTSEPKLGINPQVGISEDTPKGIYFYPLKYALDKTRYGKLPWGDNYPYIQLFQYDRSGEMTKQTKVDPAKLKKALLQYCPEEVIQQASEEGDYDGTPYWFIYDCLSRLGKSDETNVIRWNKVLRDLGFTSVYDDGDGWIAYNEPTQGVVLDPRIIKQHKTIANKKKSGVVTPAVIEQAIFDTLDMELASNRAWQKYDPDGSKLRQAAKEYAKKPEFKPYYGKPGSEEIFDKAAGWGRYGARELSQKAYEWFKEQQGQPKVNEASGYIPSEKEKNDPRFKTALTVDIKPDTMKKDAKKFGNKISRAGIPPTLKASGKF